MKTVSLTMIFVIAISFGITIPLSTADAKVYPRDKHFEKRHMTHSRHTKTMHKPVTSEKHTEVKTSPYQNRT